MSSALFAAWRATPRAHRVLMLYGVILFCVVVVIGVSGQRHRDELREEAPHLNIRESSFKNLTYSQMMTSLDSWFAMEESPLADGRPRWFAQSKDGLAILELIGQSEDLESATFIFGVPEDATSDQLVKPGAALLILLQNADPSWGTDAICEWATRGVYTLDPRNPECITITRERIEVEARALRASGMIRFTIRPRLAVG